MNNLSKIHKVFKRIIKNIKPNILPWTMLQEILKDG